MATTSCLFWIKFFIWIAAFSGLATLFTSFGLNAILSFILGAVITSPILFADYIILYFIDKDKIKRKGEEGRLKQEVLESLGDDEDSLIICPKCGKKNFIGTTHCNNCGKDLRVAP